MAAFPEKKLVLQNAWINSEKWNDFKMRDDDMIVATAYKSGTTWTQNILYNLLHQGEPFPEDGTTTLDQAPWLDLSIPPMVVLNSILEPMTTRRQIKTHLRLDALKFNPKAKYIYIGRDGRDVYVSFCNHYENTTAQLISDVNNNPDRVGGATASFQENGYTVKTWFDDWISKADPCFESFENDGYPFWSLFDNVNSWWQHRHCENIFFVHFNDLRADLAGSMREIAAFFDIPIQEEHFSETVKRCTFDFMKENASKTAPLGGAVWEGGGKTFINKGTNGRWKDILSEEQLKKYDEKVAEKLTPECALWLEKGKAAFDPKSV